jgi:hypothetical protein
MRGGDRKLQEISIGKMYLGNGSMNSFRLMPGIISLEDQLNLAYQPEKPRLGPHINYRRNDKTLRY